MANSANFRSRLVFLALLCGPVVNVAAGIRRPLIERAILRSDHYAAADRAADAVRMHVPEHAALSLVVYDRDLLGELDCAVWADYRFKWLLYPRRIDVLRCTASGELRADPRYPLPSGSLEPSGDRYLLYFRVTAEPQLPGNERAATRDRNFALVREPKPGGAVDR